MTDKNFTRWFNPEYPNDQIDKWFNMIDKSLLTIGRSGVQESHVKSLEELLKSHERVRVKIASDKMNITEIANRFVASPQLSNSQLLTIRQTEFMIGSAITK